MTADEALKKLFWNAYKSGDLKTAKDIDTFKNKTLLEELRNKIIQNLIDNNVDNLGTMNDFVKKVSSKITKLSKEQLERFIEDMSAQNDAINAIMDSLQTGLLIVDQQWNLLKANKAVDHLIPLKKRSSEIEPEKSKLWDVIDEEYMNNFFKECSSLQKYNVAEEFSIANDNNVRFISVEIVAALDRVFFPEDFNPFV